MPSCTKRTPRSFLNCMRSFLTALALIITLSATAGGEKFQINFMIQPSGEWLWFSASPNAAAYNNLWGPKLSYNFGLEYKRFFDPSLSLSTGILYMNKGFRNVDPFAGVDGKKAVTLMSAHIASIPLYLNIHNRISRRVEMIYTIGVAGGYIFAERARNRNYSNEAIPNQGILDVTQEQNNVNLFNDVYVGAHAGVGISAYLKSRVVLVVQPMYKFQINNARDYLGQFASGDPFNARLNSLGLDLRIGYFFTKQVRNRKKEI